MTAGRSRGRGRLRRRGRDHPRRLVEGDQAHPDARGHDLDEPMGRFTGGHDAAGVTSVASIEIEVSNASTTVGSFGTSPAGRAAAMTSRAVAVR